MPVFLANLDELWLEENALIKEAALLGVQLQHVWVERSARVRETNRLAKQKSGTKQVWDWLRKMGIC